MLRPRGPGKSCRVFRISGAAAVGWLRRPAWGREEWLPSCRWKVRPTGTLRPPPPSSRAWTGLRRSAFCSRMPNEHQFEPTKRPCERTTILLRHETAIRRALWQLRAFPGLDPDLFRDVPLYRQFFSLSKRVLAPVEPAGTS